MSDFDYGKYFGPIVPLADALRENDARVWTDGGERQKQPHDYVLYLGCNVLRTVALAETIDSILKRMGVDFVALGGPAMCCGVIHHGNGDMEVSEKLTRQSLGKMADYSPKAVLVYCPSCHSHMDHALGETEITFDVPYLHVTEFIVDNLHRLTFDRPVNRRVFLHAHGGSDQNIKDATFARAILDAIPGLEVVGDPGDTVWGRDCGSREINRVGVVRHAGLVRDMFATARDAGADGIAALYHSCYRTICASEAVEGLEVVHYTSLVAEALGMPRREERFKPLKLAADADAAFEGLKDRAAARGLDETRLRQTLNAHFGKR